MGNTATFRAKFNEEDNLKAAFTEDEQLNAEFGEATKVSTSDYNDLYNKPQINGVELKGDKSLEDLGDAPLTNLEIKEMFNNIFG